MAYPPGYKDYKEVDKITISHHNKFLNIIIEKIELNIDKKYFDANNGIDLVFLHNIILNKIDLLIKNQKEDEIIDRLGLMWYNK